MGRKNVQSELLGILSTALGGVEVRTSVPDPRPRELVVVRREGGSMRNALIDAPGIGIDIWAGSEARACEIAEAVSGTMLSLGFSDGYASVKEEAFLSQYDTRSGTPHWYASYSLRTFQTR